MVAGSDRLPLVSGRSGGKMPTIFRLPRLPRLVLIAPFAACVAAAAWGAYECIMSGLPLLRAWAATTSAAAVPAAAGLPLVPAAFVGWRRLAPQLRRVWRHGLRRPRLAWAFFVTAITSLAAAALAERLTGLEPAAVTTAMACGVVLAVGVAALVGWVFQRWLERSSDEFVRSRVMRALALASVALWLAVLWQPVSLTLYFLHMAWLPESVVVVALVFALMLAADRWAALSLGLLPAGAAAALLLLHHARADLPNRVLTRLLRQRELTSHWLPWLSKGETLHAPTAAGSTCFPGVLPQQNLGVAPDGAPDILFITVDGVAFRHTSFGDPKANHTPRLLARAKEAAVFTRAYTPAPWTRLAFRSLFTGLDPGLVPSPPATKWGMSFAPEQKTLATYLKDGGYQTIALVSEPRIFSTRHNALLGFSTIDSQSKAFVQTYHYESSFKVNQAIGFLLELPKTAKPRFLWTHILDTHFPYSAGPGRNTADVAEPDRHRMALEFVDAELSRLLDFALAADRRDRTWVIITADHGEAFTEHGQHRHGYTVYEEELHVPLLVFGPKVVPRQIDQPVSTVALTRTILEAAGLQPPNHMCGASLLGSLTSGIDPTASPVFAATLPDKTTEDTFKLAWIDGGSKLIWSPAQSTYELYDLERDPGEKNNLADAHPNRAAAMAAALRAYLAAQGRDLEGLERSSQEEAAQPAGRDAAASPEAAAMDAP